MTRYGNKKIDYKGIKFDSKMEGEYYKYLLQNKKDCTIQVHPKYILQEKFVYQGRKIQPITYTADFLVTYPDGRKQVIDVKGMPSIEAHIKKKLFWKRYPDLDLIRVVYVKKRGGRITWEDNKLQKKQEKKSLNTNLNN